MGSAIVFLVHAIISLAIWAVIISAVLSWLVAFDVINTRNRGVYQVMTTLERIISPMLSPIQRIIPSLGGVDISPIILILLLQAVNFLVSFAIVSLLFAAVYKILPSKPIRYRDVMVGAVATAFMFTVGKTGIGLYLGSSTIASSYGAAGAFVIVLLWIYYSSQIFLLGAEFTKAWAAHHGSEAAEGTDQPVTAPIIAGAGAHVEVARHAASRSGTRWVDVVAVAGVLYAVMRSQRRLR